RARHGSRSGAARPAPPRASSGGPRPSRSPSPCASYAKLRAAGDGGADRAIAAKPAVQPGHALLHCDLRRPAGQPRKSSRVRNVILLTAAPPLAERHRRPRAVDRLEQVEALDEADGVARAPAD